ncbi:conserved hypothetical protein [Leishmania mexicana MHOM/GT/2001/U1103]|uniref:SMP-LTD domain-containing protein n=1 Tax=Leishmania mexicana (strain MHOM/GT/2001/U1103) TaxID=929439 RepID=E9AZZ1_LEIMU|nr:conserved hypothetical protein [Leishmania mexicana MHOM/GT/2001/U1103]CBZ28542.1 conserved hypothetical protein [Leishmania mexicana MHOM/GT/2001/U1103]
MPLPWSAGGSVGGSGGSGVGPGVSISGLAISTTAQQHNSGYHGAGATVLAADTHNGNNGGGPSESASFAGEPIAAPAAAINRTPVGSWPCFGSASSTAAASCATATSAAGGTAHVPGAAPASSPSPDAAESASKVPPIVYLEVGRVEWGTTPPFVEIVAFENAVDGPPGRTRQHLQQQQGRAHFGGGRDGQGTTGPETRGTSPYTSSHSMSTETLMTTSTAAVEPGTGFAAAADNISECSHGLPSRVHTGGKTPHPVTGSHRLFDGASAGGGGVGGVDMYPHQQPASSSSSQFPSQPEPVDSLASVLGPGGLYVRFHVTYGGSMHLSLNIAVQHEIRLGAVALRVSLPMMFCIANLDLDCYICVNMKHNTCEVWLEPGPLSPSVVNRLRITAIVGGDDDDGGSSTDFYSHFGSSSISDGDGGEEGSGVYVNEHEVSQFVLHELRSILRETLVAPHSVRIPVSFGGS